MATSLIAGRLERTKRGDLFTRVKRRGQQLPALYPLFCLLGLLAFWGAVAVGQFASHSKLSAQQVFDIVFAVQFDEAWYALAVIAAIVVALSVAALGTSENAATLDADAVAEYVARGQRLRLFSRLAAVSASIISMDAVITSLAAGVRQQTFAAVESAVILLVAYFLGAIAEDAGARSYPIRALEKSLQQEALATELHRLRRARVHWMPSALGSRLPSQFARLFAWPILALMAAGASALDGYTAAGRILTIYALLLLFGVLFAAVIGYLAAVSVVFRQPGGMTVSILLTAVFAGVPAAAWIQAATHSDSTLTLLPRLLSVAAVFIWLYPWAVMLRWLTQARAYDIRTGKRDALPTLSRALISTLDSTINKLVAESGAKERKRKERWFDRATGWSTFHDLPPGGQP